MANSLQSIQHSPLKLSHHTDSIPIPLFLKPTSLAPLPTTITTTTTTNTTNNTTSKIFTTFSLSSSSSLTSSTSTTSSSTPPISFDLLQKHLSSQNFRLADEETRRLLIALAGEAALKRGYVFFSEVQFIAEADLRAIDSLWREHSNGKFGYSAQKRIWEKRSRKDFTKFFIRVGWMKKLDTEVEQYNYRAFPDEFIWELKDDTPEGHLPLTNALRGTQLLNSILTHPAFDGLEEEQVLFEEEVDNKVSEMAGQEDLNKTTTKPTNERNLKPDYSF